MSYEEPGEREDAEQQLPRGDVTEGVVRVGTTVRRPAQPQSAAVADYLQHLEAVGFRGAPRFLGRDRAGRDVLDYLEGDVAGDPVEPWAADEALLVSVGRLLRELHTASEGYAASRGFAAPPGASWFVWPPPSSGTGAADLAAPDPELVSHNDVTPQNVIVRGGRAVGLIDFDLAGPTTRLEDFCNTATHWVPLRDPVDVWPGWTTADQPVRLRLLADAYGLTPEERASLVDLLARRTERVWLRMKGAAEQLGGGWSRMWDDGVGDLIKRRGAWLTSTREDFIAALR
jgi:hypothetical protein